MCDSKGCCGGSCSVSLIIKILLIVGGINWGLVGVGMLVGGDWNAVGMIFGSLPVIEAIVYILVGIAAVMKIFNCKCTKCAPCCQPENKTEGAI